MQAEHTKETRMSLSNDFQMAFKRIKLSCSGRTPQHGVTGHAPFCFIMFYLPHPWHTKSIRWDFKPGGGCTKAKVHMTWKHDGALMWLGQIVERSARPWQDWSPRDHLLPKCPGSFGGERGFTWKITVLDSKLPLPCWSKSKLQLATASFRDMISNHLKPPNSFQGGWRKRFFHW